MNDKSPIKLNGKLIDPEIEELNGVTTRKVEVSLPPGARATVRFDSDKGP